MDVYEAGGLMLRIAASVVLVYALVVIVLCYLGFAFGLAYEERL